MFSITKGSKKQKVRNTHMSTSITNLNKVKFSYTSAIYFQGEEKPKMVFTNKVISEIVLVCILAVCIIVATTITYHFYKEASKQVELGRRIYFDEQTRLIHVNNVHKELVLYGHLGLEIPEFHLPYDCSDKDRRGVEMCLHWRDEAVLNITYFEEDGKNCYDIEWESFSKNILPHDCYQLSGGHWYGGGLRQNQEWPIEKMSYEKTVLLPGNLHNENTFGPVVERYWLSSLGVAMFVEDDSPLHVQMNQSEPDDQICFVADYADSLYPSQPGQYAKMNYTICTGENVKEIHKYVVNKIGKPSLTHPADKYFQKPVWSIGNQYGFEYTQPNVEEYAALISADQEYLHSMIVLDQGWQEKEGDLEFDPQRFTNSTQMITNLKEKGFDVCLAIHPFVNTNSEMFQTAVGGNYLVYDGSASTPGLGKWWDGPQNPTFYQGVAASIDMQSTSWWHEHLKNLVDKYGPLQLRMNHGDMEFMPHQVRFHEGYTNPGQYTKRLAEFVTSLGASGQVQSVYRAQNQPVILRLGDFNSSWESLQSVIPSVLHAGIIGYPYIMPDIIGGNHPYTDGSTLPDKELYIRWLQLSTFLPIMQFSVHPAKYDAETITIAKQMISLRSSLVENRVVSLVKEASQSMDPVVRPMWWRDPADEETYSLDDQFLLGDDLLVAPVLTQSRSRDVYFPSGTWQDQVSQRSYVGPSWQRDLQVSLNRVLYFVLVN